MAAPSMSKDSLRSQDPAVSSAEFGSQSFGQRLGVMAEQGDIGPPNIVPTLSNTEETPLLLGIRENDGQEFDRVFADDFAHLPPLKKPSVWWILTPFALFALTFGGTLVPKIDLILDMMCREYFAEQSIFDPAGDSTKPGPFGIIKDDNCRFPAGVPEVQHLATRFSLYGNLIGGIVAALVSPRLGILSDRYGRKSVIMFAFCGTILAELVAFIAALNVATFPPYLFLVSYLIDGLCGSFTASMAVAHAYASDCTPPKKRNVVFGYFHACLFIGIGLGPVLAGLIVKATQNLAVVFAVAAGAQAVSVLFIAIFVPESLSSRRKEAAQEKHRLEREVSNSSILRRNPFAPLKILYPTGAGSSSAIRRNLMVLAAIDSIVLGVAMGSGSVLIYYSKGKFGWETFESSVFLSVVGLCRVLALLLVLPLLTRIFHHKTHSAMRENAGATPFDVNIIRAAIFFDVLGYTGFTLAPDGVLFTLSAALASLGGLASPAMQSALTRHVPKHKTGHVLGAVGLLHALSRIAGPTIFLAIYNATVGKPTVFICLTATFAFCFLMSWTVRPNVVLKATPPASSAGHPTLAEDD